MNINNNRLIPADILCITEGMESIPELQKLDLILSNCFGTPHRKVIRLKEFRGNLKEL